MKRLIFSIITLACTAMGASAQETLTLTLQQCRDRALEFNEQMQTASNATQQAKLDREIAFTNYLPKIEGTAMTGWMKDSEMMGMTMQMRGFYMAGLQLQQPIYAGGRIKAGNDLTKIGRQVSEQQQRKTRQEVIAEADQAYWGYISVLQKVEMLKSYQEYMKALADKVDISVEAEMASRNEQLRVEAKANEVDYNLQKAQTGAELCRLVLCNAIGADFDTQIIPADRDVPITAPEDMDENIEQTPEMQMMQMGVKAKKKQVNLTRGDFLPTLAAVAGYTWYGNIKMKGETEYNGQMVPFTQEMKSNTPMLMLSLSVPIWKWGEGYKKVKKAKLDVENAQLDMARNQRLLTIQARQAILNVTNGYTQIETAQKGVDNATENLRVMQERYDADMSTLTDLLDAQSQWQQAQSNLIEAKTQYKLYQTEYLKAVGRL
jgi:outer membrane protein TolC